MGLVAHVAFEVVVDGLAVFFDLEDVLAGGRAGFFQGALAADGLAGESLVFGGEAQADEREKAATAIIGNSLRIVDLRASVR